MIKVRIPNICTKEQKYSLDVLLGEFLGLSFEVEPFNGDVIELACNNSNKKLTLNADFFITSNQAWFKPVSMPVLPLKIWAPAHDGLDVDLVEEFIPVLYGQPGLIKNDRHWHLNLDIFGSAFFMLSRYEELITLARDQHNRFPSTASVSYKANFLDRPIVDEYLEVLLACMLVLWPDLKPKHRQARNFITCDTDWPFEPWLYSGGKMIRRFGGLLLKEKAFSQAMNLLAKYIWGKIGFKINDEYRESINWMMDVNEDAGNVVAFNFIAFQSSQFDTKEDFDSPRIREIFKEIHERGHEIGVHPGYCTFDNRKNFMRTVFELNRILQEEGIVQSHLGGRQHYLRWDTSQTPHLYEECGLEYDSTLGYADKGGFRCGTCHDFTMFDLMNRKPFKLKQRPLIVMECSVIASRYEALAYSKKSFLRFKYFKDVSRKFNGSFNLLWHNHHFLNKEDKVFYLKLIENSISVNTGVE